MFTNLRTWTKNLWGRLSKSIKGEVGALQRKHQLRYCFSIGLIPAQEFIEEARRSRDLRAGSAILSFLMLKTLQHLVSKGADIRVPHESCLPDDDLNIEDVVSRVQYSIPNHASGYIVADNIERMFANLHESCLQPAWQGLFETCFVNDDYPKAKMGSWREYFINEFKKDKNKKCPLELVWAIKPASSSPDNSGEDLEEINRCYVDLKRTRPVRPWSGDNVGKCDQCGKREAVGPTTAYHEWRDWQEKLSREPWVKSGERLSAGERLCMVCFTKRFVGYARNHAERDKGKAGSFPSTSGIAARTWVKELKRLGILEFRIFDKSRKGITQVGDPESLYYESGIRRYERRYGKQTPGSTLTHETQRILAQLRVLRGQRRELVDRIAGRGRSIERPGEMLSIRPDPSNYLAVLCFDGDRMGAMINKYMDSGLPEQLVQFSQAVMERFHGEQTGYAAELFYVGGDEGLLLTPVETALQTAIDLRKLFGERMKTIDPSITITMSLGMTVFAHERPLGGAIHLARRALEQAKAVKDKNALSVTIQTASGNEFSTTASWQCHFWERVGNAIKLITNKSGDPCRLSMGWAHEVEAFLRSLPAECWQNEIFEAVTSEVKRITFRKLEVDNGIPPAAKREQKEKTWATELRGETWFGPSLQELDQETISNQFHTIAFLVRESSYQSVYVDSIPEREEI